jgi:hypothetical protein
VHAPRLIARLVWSLALAGLFLISGCKGCKDQPKQGRRTIATLASARGDVQHRAAGTMRWSGAKTGEKLAARDAVKTGGGAGATVLFSTGSKLELDEKTLVIIEAPRAKGKKTKVAPAVARVERGVVRGQVAAGSAIELTRPGGGSTRVAATGTTPLKLRISAGDKGALRIASLGGSATVSAGDQRVELKDKQGVAVAAGDGGKTLGKKIVLPAYPQLLNPAVDAQRSATNIELSWRAVEGAARYHVQLAKTTSFDDLVHDTFVNDTAWRIAKLKPGSYVWRVATASGEGWEGEFGFARRFVVKSTPPAPPRRVAKLVSPLAGRVMAAKDGKSTVIFRWEPIAGVDRYTLVIAKDAKLSEVIDRKESKQRRRRLRLPIGSYHWGIFGPPRDGKPEPLFDSPP